MISFAIIAGGLIDKDIVETLKRKELKKLICGE
jgi:hypothetical protein